MKKQNNAPQIRFQNFEDEWINQILGKTVEIIMGQSPDSKNYTDNPNDYILVQGNADMQNGVARSAVVSGAGKKLLA